MKHRLLLNNSYESEQSSSNSPPCENSIEDKNSNPTHEINNLNLPDLLKPKLNNQQSNEINDDLIPRQTKQTISYLKKQSSMKQNKFSTKSSQEKSHLIGKNMPIKSYSFNHYNRNKYDNSSDSSLDEEDGSPVLQLPSKNKELLKIEANMRTIFSREASHSNNFINNYERSPELFDSEDDNDYDKTTNDKKCENISFLNDSATQDSSFFSNKVNQNHKYEKQLLKRIKNCLSGVPPPPSVTNSQFDLFNIVTENKDKIINFFHTIRNECEQEVKNDGTDKEELIHCNLMKPTNSFDEIQNFSWPEILTAKYHGLCYNHSSVTEEIEHLNMLVAERYIGVETSSSFKNISLIQKKPNSKLKSIQSPGSRLSHLARRRAAFSSANLQMTFQNQIPKNIAARQILIDSKKSDNRRKSKIKTPKRITPGKTAVGPPTRETSKRALFQSPPVVKSIQAPKPLIKPEIANRVEKSKRALFSPDNSQNEMKRKRLDGNSIIGNPNKIIRTDYENATPRSLKFKSQSFCVGAGTSYNNNKLKGKPLTRASSDTVCSNQLSDLSRKKLLWAVSQALQTKKIGVENPKFNHFAAILARATKRIFLEFYSNVKITSTSEIMLRLTKKLVHYALSDMSADDIYLNEKNRLLMEKQILSAKRLSGYIAPEDYENVQNTLKKNMSGIFLSNSYDNLFSSSQQTSSQSSIFEFSASSQKSISQNNNSITNLSALKLSQQMIETSSNLYQKLTASPSSTSNLSLQNNSSSKSNLGGIVLRENVDCEQRKSVQKNFTGKDMKNTSPYIIDQYNHRKTPEVKHVKVMTTNIIQNDNNLNLSILKAKRQISFDN